MFASAQTRQILFFSFFFTFSISLGARVCMYVLGLCVCVYSYEFMNEWKEMKIFRVKVGARLCNATHLYMCVAKVAVISKIVDFLWNIFLNPTAAAYVEAHATIVFVALTANARHLAH